MIVCSLNTMQVDLSFELFMIVDGGGGISSNSSDAWNRAFW